MMTSCTNYRINYFINIAKSKSISSVRENLSAEKVAYIWLLLNEKKLSITEISSKLKISRSCVYKYQRSGPCDVEEKQNKPKGGRPRKLSDEKCEN